MFPFQMVWDCHVQGLFLDLVESAINAQIARLLSTNNGRILLAQRKT